MSLLKNELREELVIIILCAGEGKRLKKLTKDTPKPLLKPKKLESDNILQNTIFKLIKLGINQIAIVTGYLGDSIKEYISRLIKFDVSLQNKLIIINSEDQYKSGPLYSFLSITENKVVYNEQKYYLLIPGDTIFDFNLLKEILLLISKNYVSFQKYPLIFYRNIEANKLLKLYNESKIISNAELDIKDLEIKLKRIFQLKIKDISSNIYLNEIIPIFFLSYDFVQLILNLKDNIPFTTIWETINYLLSSNIPIYALNVENKYQFYDIDFEKDLLNLKKKEDNRCSD